MKALVYTGTREVVFRDEPAPVAAADEAIVAIDAVGICGSDMHAYLGHDPRRVPPLILGHEAAGTVVEGPGRGRRAVLNPLITCGQCDNCLGGRQNLCVQRDLIGMYRPGAFAEQIAIPARNLITIPDDMDAAHAALTEPAATALHAVNLASKAAYRPLSETRALVFGGGSVGLFAALVLADQGAREIHLAEINPLRRQTADLTGVCRAFDPQATPAQESYFDVVIDAVGSKTTRQTAIYAVRPGGVVMHIGLLDNEGEIDVRRMTLQEITFIGTYTYTPVDLRVTVNKLYAGALGRLDWIEQRPLTDGASAFTDLLQGRCAAPKVILRPDISN